MRPSVPILLVATGLALVVGGFAYHLAFAGIPDQDPGGDAP